MQLGREWNECEDMFNFHFNCSHAIGWMLVAMKIVYLLLNSISGGAWKCPLKEQTICSKGINTIHPLLYNKTIWF
jgi:thiosulfate reductase cytochrome b subunit